MQDGEGDDGSRPTDEVSVHITSVLLWTSSHGHCPLLFVKYFAVTATRNWACFQKL